MPQSLLTPQQFIEHLEERFGQRLGYSDIIFQVCDYVLGWNQQNSIDHQIIGYTRNNGGGFCILSRGSDFEPHERIETHFAVIIPQQTSFRLDLYVDHNCQHLYPNYFKETDNSMWRYISGEDISGANCIGFSVVALRTLILQSYCIRISHLQLNSPMCRV